MAFESNIGAMPVIDDSNFHDFVEEADDNPQHGRGLHPRDYDLMPQGFAGPKFDLPLIPTAEWPERIEEAERKQTRIIDLVQYNKIPVKNQRNTNYCWINAPIFCLEVIRAIQGEQYIPLSPASVGAKIKNFRNVGGWGTEGLEYLVEKGAVPSSMWPDTAIQKQYDTPEANAERAKYQVDEWWDLKPRSMQQLATCVLNNIPVAVGYNWWSHEVTAVGLVIVKGNVCLQIANSWGDWGDKGYGVLGGTKMLPDDAVAPRTATGG